MTERRLALDTSGQTQALVVLEGKRMVAAKTWVRASREAGPPLLARIQALAEESGWRVSELEAIGAGRGPGSFTSLRVGLSAAAGLASGCRAKPFLLDSLRILAGQTDQATGALRDAGHGEAYAWRPEHSAHRLLVSDLDGWMRWDDRIVVEPAGRLADWAPKWSSAEVPPTERRPPDAALAVVAIYEFENGKAVRYDEVRPLYAQPAAAEARRKP